jgi:Tol biopolymer transport system component
MRSPRWPRVLAAALLALCAIAIVGPSHAAPPGVIVFASDRDKANPGEIYSLTPGRSPSDVSNSLASESDMAVDPVGDLIAFWSDRSGQGRVYLARSDGSHVRPVRTVGAGVPLEQPQGNGGSPLVFTTDGRRLFASLAITSLSGATTWHDFAIDPGAATARAIPACAGIFDPAPDGKAIACVVRGRTTITDLAGHVRARLPGAYLVWSSRGSLATSSTNGQQQSGSTLVVDEAGARIGHVTGVPVAWSPDGQILVFQRSQTLFAGNAHDFAHARVLLRGWPGGLVSFTQDSRYLSAANAAGKPVLLPLAGGRTIAGLDGGRGVWSRTGRVAYVGSGVLHVRPGVTFPVLVTDSHGRNPQVVGRFPLDDHAILELRWLPDSRAVLLLTSNSCGATGLFTVSTTGGAARALTHDPRNLGSPTSSSDGSTIAYGVGQFGCHLGEGESTHIETVQADGTGVQRVTDDGDGQLGNFDSGPSFSPDGTQITFSHGTFDSGTIQVVATAGGARTTLLPPAGANVGSTPAWSPDGARIAYVSGQSIMAVAPSGGTPAAIASNPDPDSCSGVAWSRDGTQLATACTAGIYVITLAPPSSARLAIGVKGAANPAFSPDGTQIAFDAPPPSPLGNESAIMLANTDGSNVRVLSAVPFHQSVHPSWLPVP